MVRNMFSPKKMLVIALVVWVVLSLVAGCAGSSRKAEEKGSLSRTFMLLDEEGRQAGKLVLEPSGNAKLLDANDQVVGQFTFAGAGAKEQAAAPASKETPPEPETSEVETEEKTPE
jgi:hypothetical protein